MPKNKTDNFLKAIKSYAKHRKNVMQGEVKQLKTERLKEAEEQASLDCEKLIREKYNESQNHQTALLAAKTQEGQRKLFIARAAMTEEIFQAAADKLVAFTETKDYSAKLIDSAKKISAMFAGKDCVLYINERDLSASEQIKAQFDSDVAVKTDKTIKIGGIKGYCAEIGIIADETLDSKLEAQRKWFVENAALSVL